MELNDRLLQIDTALIGKWEDSDIEFFFEGMGLDGNLGEVSVYQKDKVITEAHYKLLIKDDGAIGLLIIFQLSDKRAVWEFTIDLIDNGKGELNLSTPLGKELFLKQI